MAEWNKPKQEAEKPKPRKPQRHMLTRWVDGKLQAVVVGANKGRELEGDWTQKDRYLTAVFDTSKDHSKTDFFERLYNRVNCLHCMDSGLITFPTEMPNGKTYDYSYACFCQDENAVKANWAHSTATIWSVKPPDYVKNCQLEAECTMSRRDGKCFSVRCPKP